VTVNTPARHDAEFDALLHWQPVELVTHQLGHTSRRRKPQDETSRIAHKNRLRTVEQAQRSVVRDTITIVQSTADSRTDDRVRRIRRQ